MGTCACVDMSQKTSSASYIDITANISNLLFRESSNTIGMIEPSEKTSSTQIKVSEKTALSKLKPVYNQYSTPSLTEKTNQSINPSPYKNYIESNKTEINITLLGNSQTGKSAFVIKSVNRFFEKLYIPSIGVEYYVKKKKYNRKEFIINFKITPGNKGYKVNYEEVLCKNDFMFLFFDVSQKNSFNESISMFQRNVGTYEKTYPGKVKNVIIVGSKIDVCPRKEEMSKIQMFCLENNYKLFEISSKTKSGFKELFSYVLKIHNELLMTIKD